MHCLSIYFQIVNILRYFCLWLMFLFVFPGELFDFEHGNCTAGAWENRKKNCIFLANNNEKYSLHHTSLRKAGASPRSSSLRWSRRNVYRSQANTILNNPVSSSLWPLNYRSEDKFYFHLSNIFTNSNEKKTCFITLSIVYIQISNTYLPEFLNTLLYVEANPVWICR